ncbi:MAG: ATP-binding protein [Candidatus Paceibacterota bacterium]
MDFNFDVINIIILVVIVLNLSLGIFVFLTKRESRINQSFFVFLISATFWCASMFLFRGLSHTNLAVVLSRILYVSAALIPFTFIYFINIFPKKQYNLPYIFNFLLPIPMLIVIFISIYPYALINGVMHISGKEPIILFNSSYHTVYALYILSYFSICYFLLFTKYLNFKGVEKEQIRYIIIGTLLSTLIGVGTNLLMPYFNDFRLNWLGQVGIIAMIGSISFSVIRHRLFNLKIVATQYIVFLLCTSLFVRSLLSSSSSDLTINIIFLLIMIFIGVLLIKSVIQEVRQKEKLQVITLDLEKINGELENANEKLHELDKLKSEFLSLATHQIRAPLTAIKGYASLILEGDYGETSNFTKKAVQTIFDSTENLVVIVNDFLDISRIEQGRMKYEKEVFDTVSLVKESVDQLKPNIEKADLSIKINYDDTKEYKIEADKGKMRQIIENIIDNSIKYTLKGGIEISILSRDDMIRIECKDTGIGIDEDDIKKLFSKFVRAKDANKTNVIGTGLGLYVAKQMVEAQGGKVWAESEGKDKGSTFIIELPKQS